MNKEYSKGKIVCIECGYQTDFMDYKKAEYQVYLNGGYYRFDENGQKKHRSICPSCEKNKLFYDPS